MEYALLGLVVVLFAAAIYVGSLKAKADRVDQAEAERDKLQDQAQELADRDQAISRADADSLWLRIRNDGAAKAPD